MNTESYQVDSTESLQTERRHEPRYDSAERITWKQIAFDDAFPGYVKNRSQSSVAFITAAKSTPPIGQEVEVIGPDLSQEQHQVMRIAPYDAHISLVACRRADWDPR